MPHLTEQGDTKTEKELITPKLVDWLLYDLPYLRERCEEIMPHTSTDIVFFHPKTKTMVRSKIEIVAVKRAALTSVLDAVDRAIKRQDRVHKQIYRMKYRAGMSVREIAKKTFFNKNSVQKKVDELRMAVMLALQGIPASHLTEFLGQKVGQKWDKNEVS